MDNKLLLQGDEPTRRTEDLNVYKNMIMDVLDFQGRPFKPQLPCWDHMLFPMIKDRHSEHLRLSCFRKWYQAIWKKSVSAYSTQAIFANRLKKVSGLITEVNLWMREMPRPKLEHTRQRYLSALKNFYKEDLTEEMIGVLSGAFVDVSQF